MGKKIGVFGIRSVEMGNVSTIGKHTGLDPENRYEVKGTLLVRVAKPHYAK